jgi:hypothetical protein
MKDLAHALRELAGVFEKLELPYAVMVGLAVRVYGIPRPAYDVDFTVDAGRATYPISATSCSRKDNARVRHGTSLLGCM